MIGQLCHFTILGDYIGVVEVLRNVDENEWEVALIDGSGNHDLGYTSELVALTELEKALL